MRPSTDRLLVWLLVLLIGACAGPGPARRAAGDRSIPVPVSAAQRADFERALAAMRKQRHAEAVPILERIFEENPRLPGVAINLAIAYLAMAEAEPEAAKREPYHAKAERVLLKALEENPREAAAHHQLGLVLRRQGRLEAARDAYEKALDIDPQYALAHYNLAVLCDLYLQDTACAIRHFEAYRALRPEEAETIDAWLTELRRRAGAGGAS